MLFKEWDALLDAHQAPTNAPVPTYAQVVHAVNTAAGENDTLISAAGGLPGEVAKGWRVKAPNTFDLEFGFSCMGYEIAAGWGHAMAEFRARRARWHADRHGRRRHLYDDELGHLFDGAERPQDDRRRLRQWRLRGDQPAAAGQGRAGLQQSVRPIAACRIAPIRFTSISPSTRNPWARRRAIARASPTL